MTTLRACTGCERQMRPRKALAAAYPDTVQHQGRGLCYTCWRARNRRDETAWVAAQRGHLTAWLAWRGRVDQELAA